MFTFRGGIEDRVSALETEIVKKASYIGQVTDLNTSNGEGVKIFKYSSSASNKPSNDWGMVLEMMFSAGVGIQIAFTHANSAVIYKRINGGSGWGAWISNPS